VVGALPTVSTNSFPSSHLGEGGRLLTGEAWFETRGGSHPRAVRLADKDPGLSSWVRGFESRTVRHFGTKLGTPTRRSCAEAATSVRRPHDANFFRIDLNALSERAQVIAAVAAAVGAHALAGGLANASARCNASTDVPSELSGRGAQRCCLIEIDPEHR
jgi:hypothetical protein